ncbi:bactericidal permeability-increasing protein [Stylonychia lemnae]|uniref:Bactericidal permeability-increasing protein n=1 Tax=Stylonychia lemnae TaxID=5949 RepID=A0A078A0A3_STYLE|nr:bactericidal permeability-increasing protein [Stylonychia lemnae]|eukprot:CDW75575.1 bactericidal permeability-increasing protein [Stylonychia lemnae]
MTQNLVLILALCAFSTIANANLAGTAAAVDIGVVNQVKNWAMPTVLNIINNYDVGKIEFSEGQVDNIKINLAIQDLNSINVGFVGASNSISCHAQDISGEMSGSYKFKFLFLSTSGNFKVRIDDGGATINMLVPLLSQTINGKKIPAVGINNFNLNIDSSKIHIDLSGSIIADIADAFVSLFKSLILGKINGIINDDIPPIIKDKINGIVADTNGIASFYKELALDFTFVTDPIITDNNMALFLNATIYNSTSGYKIPGEQAEDIQVLPSVANSVQMSLSHYTADSFLMAIHEENLLQYTVDGVSFPSIAEELTTTYLDGLLPGLVQKYGDNIPVQIALIAKTAPRSLFQKDALGVIIDLDLTFIVKNEVAIVVTLYDFISRVDLKLTGANLTAQLLSIKIDHATATDSKIGDFNAQDFKDFLNVSSRIVIPFINNLLLEKAFTLPSSFFGVVQVNSAQFQSFDNYLAISIVPQFI